MSVKAALLAAIAIAFLALVAAMLWYRGEALRSWAALELVQADLRVAEQANMAQQAAINRLRAEAAANDRIITDMTAQLEALNASMVEAGKALGELKAANETVRSYLDTPVPDDLRRLYDRGKAQGGGAH